MAHEYKTFSFPPGVLARLRRLAACHSLSMSGWLSNQIATAPIPEQCGETWAENGHQIGQPAVRKSDTAAAKGKRNKK